MAKSNSPNKQPIPKKVPGEEPVVSQPQTDEPTTQDDGEGEDDDDEQDPPGGIRPTKPPIIP